MSYKHTPKPKPKPKPKYHGVPHDKHTCVCHGNTPVHRPSTQEPQGTLSRVALAPHPSHTNTNTATCTSVCWLCVVPFNGRRLALGSQPLLTKKE